MCSVKNKAAKTSLLDRLPLRSGTVLKQIGTLADQREVRVYLVGGVVRDLLLRRDNWDLDLTVEGDGMSFAKAVADHYHAGLALFEKFATARLVFPDGRKLDVTSARCESYIEPAALPDVAPASIEEDLYRRDFTINAMAIPINGPSRGCLLDPYGGWRDLKTKTIRALHEKSFVDDPTRIFRAVRFKQRFGFSLERKTARWLRLAAETDQIARLSGPRLCNEILLLLGEPDPVRAVKILARLKLLRFLHPRLRFDRMASRVMGNVPRAVRWWMPQGKKHVISVQVMMLMALLMSAEPAVVGRVIERLSLSKEQAGKVRWAGEPIRTARAQLQATRAMKPSEIHRLLIEMPNEALILMLADTMAGKDRSAASRVRPRLSLFMSRLRDCRPLLRGEDLLRGGMQPGPQVGTMLNALLVAKLNGVVRTKRDEVRLVRRMTEVAAVSGAR